MSSRFAIGVGFLALFVSFAVLVPLGAQGDSKNRGLTDAAMEELSDAGVDKYLGQFTPVSSEDVGDGWIKHTFDPDSGNGPICIAGTGYSVFTRAGNPAKLLIFLQGGGACWQDFYNCNVLSEAQEPPTARLGIWDFDSKDNPFRNYSIVYMPYCDGSVFGGDNVVPDAAWQAFIEDELELPSGAGPPVRFHRGLRNVSAGMDVAQATFPNASRVTVAGSSAGGVGSAAFAPFLARYQYGNNVHLTVFNDAGPIAVNLGFVAPPDPDTCDLSDPASCCALVDTACLAVVARAVDWQFGQFYPASCSDCSDLGQQTEIVDWRLENDRTIREAFYETDGDGTNRFFTQVPTQEMYRALILSEHGMLNMTYPDRYKTFIVSGDATHTALQSSRFYTFDADGVLLNEWTDDFLVPRPFWVDIVEDFVPLP